jgi:hypothetical protein
MPAEASQEKRIDRYLYRTKPRVEKGDAKLQYNWTTLTKGVVCLCSYVLTPLTKSADKPGETYKYYSYLKNIFINLRKYIFNISYF